jgi:DNA-directed RNA polymerase specialized sigma24 family protein
MALLPQRMSEASTHSSMLRGRRSGEAWLYYRRPVEQYLRGLGCAEQDREDLTHEILIRLQTFVLLHYDPAQPFRPYLKATIRNFYFGHLRSRPRATALAEEPAARPPDDASEVPPSDDGLDPNEALLEYARQMYDQFAAEAGPRPGIRMLHAWMLGGDKQDRLAAAWKMSARQVRAHLASAADELAAWMRSRLNPDDLAQLVALARRKGVNIDLKPGTIRGLFNHLSKQKRLQALLVLSLIHQRAQTFGFVNYRSNACLPTSTAP